MGKERRGGAPLQACDPGFAMAWSWQSGLGDAHCRMAGANVLFVGRLRDGSSEGREGGLGIRRGQFAGDRELAEIRCHDGDWRPSIQQRQGVVVESARCLVRMGVPGV